MKTIAELLVKHEIVKINFQNPFTWVSGIRSPIYCDCRELMSLTDARELVVENLCKTIKDNDFNPEVVAGTATAGIPWASFVAQKLNLPLLYVRSKPKGHGAGKMVEGRCDKGKNILVVEDALSTAGSSIVSANALREELNATVTDILAIFSWDTPQAKENAEKGNVSLHPMTKFSEIAEALLEMGKITPEEKESLERFHEDPKNWMN